MFQHFFFVIIQSFWSLLSFKQELDLSATHVDTKKKNATKIIMEKRWDVKWMIQKIIIMGIPVMSDIQVFPNYFPIEKEVKL